MHNTIRKTTALFALLGAMGMAQAEGGPGDSGAGNPEASASSATHAMKSAKKAAKTGSKRANRSSGAASGAKAD